MRPEGGGWMGAWNLIRKQREKDPDCTQRTSDDEYQFRIAQNGYRHYEYSHINPEHTRGRTAVKKSSETQMRENMETDQSWIIEKKPFQQLEERGQCTVKTKLETSKGI